MTKSAKKQQTPSLLVAWLLGAGRPVLIVVILAGLFSGGWYLAWRRLGPRLLGSPEYLVRPENVEISPPPHWIHSDIRAEAFLQPTLDGSLSLMDDDLVERIKTAFKEHPWVSGVRSVTKSHPAPASAVSVRVELEYRQPVCMVDVPGTADSPRATLPVDAYGVLLPTADFTEHEAATRYLHLIRIDYVPKGPFGRRWSDPRVIGGAEIAAALGPVWEMMKLNRIEAMPDDSAGNATARPSPTEPVFALLTRVGTRITWGYAPGANVLGEQPAAEKVARLRQYFDDYDSLDAADGKPQQFDVRTLGQATSR